MIDPEQLAREFHDAYEINAIIHGWQTNKTTKVPFDDLPESNKKTMIDTCKVILNKYVMVEKNRGHLTDGLNDDGLMAIFQATNPPPPLPFMCNNCAGGIH